MKNSIFSLCCGLFMIAASSLFAQSPTVTINNLSGTNSITCANPNVSLVATCNYSLSQVSYSWSAIIVPPAFGASYAVTSPGTYTVTAYSSNSIIATKAIVIGINTTAPISSVGPLSQVINCGPGVAAICNVIAVSPTVNISHLCLSPYGGTAILNSNPASFQIVGTGTYTFVLRNNVNGCVTTKTAQVFSTSNYPTFSLTSQNNFSLGCNASNVVTVNISNTSTNPPGGPLTYTVLPPGSSTILPNGGLGTASIFPINTPGTYTAIVKDMNNQCVVRSAFTVVQNTVGPLLSTTASTNLTCPGGAIILTASGANSYTWTGGVSNGAVFNPTVTSTYSVSGTNNSTGCSSTNTAFQTIYVNPALNPVAIAITASGSVACVGQPFTLTASGANTYTWTGGITNGVGFNPTVTTTYSVSGTNNVTGCLGFNQYYLPLVSPSLSVVPSKTIFCAGVSNTLTASGANTFSWSTGGFGAILLISPNTNTVYTVSGANQFCVGSTTYSVNLSPGGIFYYTINGFEVTFLMSDPACSSYTWDFGNGTNAANNPNPKVTYSLFGDYTVCFKCNATPCESCLKISLPGNGSGGVGIKNYQLTENNFNLYPNPGNDNFIIDLNEASELSISNAIGQVIFESHAVSGKNVIQLSGYPEGIYFVTIKNSKHLTSKKWIKR
jgi:hypothetical protein